MFALNGESEFIDDGMEVIRNAVVVLGGGVGVDEFAGEGEGLGEGEGEGLLPRINDQMKDQSEEVPVWSRARTLQYHVPVVKSSGEYVVLDV